MSKVNNDNFIKYANSFQAIARLGLESISLLLDYLDHPEKELAFIHVAGTNGKGSVCAFLQEIFTSAGYCCGKYISPNMVSVCERISVDGNDISEDELAHILSVVEKASDKVLKKSGTHPTQFEIWTAAAFCYFKKKKCDIVILETGLGGCRDATNVITAPKASVITHIDMDHTEYLGNTLAQIASQKAGIIKKPNVGKGLTITTSQNHEVMKVLNAECELKDNLLVVSDIPSVYVPDGVNEIFDYKNLKKLKIGIAGYHQIENACIAIETALQLGIFEDAIRKGLKNAKNTGRFEILRKNPMLIFDGAHNPNGAKALVFSLKRYFHESTPNFIMGTMADKDISGTLLKIKEAYENAKFYAVSVKDNPRALPADKLVKKLDQFGFKAIACENIKKACELAEKENKLTVICGSLYLYKDYVDEINNKF